MVRTDPTLVAYRVVRDDGDVRVLLDLRNEVERRLLPHVDLAGLDGRSGGSGVGNVTQDDAVDIHALAAGGPTWRLVARDVLLVADIDDLVAGLPLLFHELVGTRPDRLFDHLFLGRGGESGRQDERDDS